MAKISFTAVKSKHVLAVMDAANSYFSEYKLRLVEEKIGQRQSAYTNAPKSYANLLDYEESEIKPCLEKQALFTTNFDLFVNLDSNPDCCVFAYNTSLAKYTLSIDEDLSQHLSYELGTTVIDFFEYTVVNQLIVRTFEYGKIKDQLYIPNGEDGQIDVKEGYFAKLEDLERIYFAKGEVGKETDSLGGFWKYIGYTPAFLDHADENSRRPLYLKGSPNDIMNFLKSESLRASARSIIPEQAALGRCLLCSA